MKITKANVFSTSKLTSILTLGVGLIAGNAEAVGPTSTLYLTAGDQGQNLRVLGGTTTAIVSAQANPAGNGEYAIAVSGGTIRTGGNGQFGAPAVGSTYDLNFNYTGPQLANPLNEVLDGTTDGNYNYGANWLTGAIYRYNLDWTSPAPIFNVPTGQTYLGISYDPFNNSLWVANGVSITDYTMGGGQLSSFNTSAERALAFDGADGTLWALNGGGTGIFDQYSTSGVLLQTMNIHNSDNIIGGEFALVSVPEPTTLALAGLGGLASLVTFCRRK